MIRCLQSGTVFNSLFPLDHRNIPHCTGEACFAHHVSSFLHRISVLNPGAKANYPSSGRPGRPWVAKQTIIFFELFVEPAMRFAVQRGGVWLSHSYEMGYGCRILTKKKKKRSDLCCDREKRKDKMIFFFKKCEKNYFIVNQEPIKFDRLLCQQNVNTVTI